jgi:hypothetical protein
MSRRHEQILTFHFRLAQKHARGLAKSKTIFRAPIRDYRFFLSLHFQSVFNLRGLNYAEAH